MSLGSSIGTVFFTHIDPNCILGFHEALVAADNATAWFVAFSAVPQTRYQQATALCPMPAVTITVFGRLKLTDGSLTSMFPLCLSHLIGSCT